MEFADSPLLADVRRFCADHLGETGGRQLADLAAPAFALAPGDGSAPTADRTRLGGPALLEPGTPWPECDGLPLSLFAVLDTDALAPWLGSALPGRPGLLNFFYLEPDHRNEAAWAQYMRNDYSGDPRSWRVLPADPALAADTPAPSAASSFPADPRTAEPIVSLPDTWDPVIDVLDVLDVGDGGYPACLVVHEKISEPWSERVDPYGDQAFGWPGHLGRLALGPQELVEQPATLLLQLASGDSWQWGDGGALQFMIPTRALRERDFGQAWIAFDGV